jgi:hypothetical protein
MEKFISDSVDILREGDNIQIAYDWNDIGNNICTKQRINKFLNSNEIEVVDKITSIIKRVKLEEDIIVYRGLTKEFDPILAMKQLNSLSCNLHAAFFYGSYVIKVKIPKGSNAFYLSAWQSINTKVRKQDTRYVVLLPGEFILDENEESLCTTYIYKQSIV